MAALLRDDTPDVSPKTYGTLDTFNRQVDQVRQRPLHPSAKKWLRDVYRQGAELKTHADELVVRMEAGERWLTANPDHSRFSEREDQWLAWLHEYEVIMDAIERSKEVL